MNIKKNYANGKLLIIIKPMPFEMYVNYKIDFDFIQSIFTYISNWMLENGIPIDRKIGVWVRLSECSRDVCTQNVHTKCPSISLKIKWMNCQSVV